MKNNFTSLTSLSNHFYSAILLHSGLRDKEIMAVRIFSIFLLFSAIKYILTEEYLYYIHDVDSITKGKITRYAKRQIRTTCLLECRHNENCDKPYFKEDQVERRFRECWFVKEGGGDELQLLKLSDGDKIETYEV